MPPEGSNSECSPLIAQAGHEGADHEPPERSNSARRQHLLYTAILFILINICTAMTTEFLDTGMTQLIESAACRNLVPSGAAEPTDPSRCKAPDVQSRLSLVLGWDMTFSMVPGLLAAVPYGVFADTYGPRVVLLLVFVGITMSKTLQLVISLNPDVFDIRLMWLGNLFTFIGGGTVGWEAMRYSIANSLVSERNRLNVFFALSVLTNVVSLIAGPFVYLAMNKSALLTSFIGLGFLSSGIVLSLALPKDTGKRQKTAAVESSSVPPPSASPWTTSKRILLAIKELFAHNIHLDLLLVSLIFTAIGHLENIIRLQYSTKRYGWSYGKAALVTALSSTISLAVMVVAVPLASHLLLKRYTPLTKDIYISRVGVLSLALGSFGVGLAPTSALFILALAIYKVEICYTPAVISLIASVAGAGGDTSLLYQCVAFMRCTGAIVAGPLLAEAMRAGLRLGGGWIGLAFIVAGMLQVFAACVVFSVKDRTKERDDDER